MHSDAGSMITSGGGVVDGIGGGVVVGCGVVCGGVRGGAVEGGDAVFAGTVAKTRDKRVECTNRNIFSFLFFSFLFFSFLFFFFSSASSFFGRNNAVT